MKISQLYMFLCILKKKEKSQNNKDWYRIQNPQK